MSSALPPARLALLLWSTDPAQPALCAAPFVYATAAAAMDAEVEIHFAARAVLLLRADVAPQVFPGTPPTRSLAEFMTDAHAQGVRFLGCAMAMREHLAADARLIDDFDGYAGATVFVQRALDPAWRTLVF